MKARKNIGVNMLVILITLIIVVSAVIFLWPIIFPNTSKVTIGNGVFNAKIADDPIERQNAWIGKKSVDYDQALLMVYPKSDKWLVSMSGMKTSIDIAWLDNNKKVVYFVANTEVPTITKYKIYKTNVRAKYILELAPGTISARSMKIGDTIDFNIDESQVE